MWAKTSASSLATWSIAMNWGAIDYTSSTVQMKMMKQFENVVNSSHVANKETKTVCLADFILWTTRHCDQNFARLDADQRECGMDMTYPADDSTCAGEWVRNDLGLAEKEFYVEGKEECKPLEGGICRPVSQMHYEDLAELQAKGLYDPTVDDSSTSYCPVFPSESTEKFKYCVKHWREITGGGGNLVLKDGTDSENPSCAGEKLTDGEIESPIPHSQGPVMFGVDLFSHDDTVGKTPRTFCLKLMSAVSSEPFYP